MAKNASTNFADQLLEAVKQVSGTEKEKKTTFLATISTVGESGAYKVSYEGSTYDAYSNIASYNVGDKVYVFVPDADFTNQLFILGRQKVDKENYIPTTNPFSTYVDTTGDLEKDTDNTGTKSLLANHAVWSIPLETITVASGYSFTRLGLKAHFRTNLKAKNAIRGNYGILVEVEYEYEENKQKYLDSIFYDFKNSDMVGDTLNFEVFTEQTAVFDISEIKERKGEIKGIYLTFYQDANFVNKNNEGLNKAKPIYSQGKATGKYRTYNENPKYNNDIEVKNVYVSLGYDENDYSTNTAIIYCAQDRDYSSFEGTSLSEDEKNEKNEKLIEARWIYHNSNAENDDDKIVAIDRASELPEGAQIYWFRYEPKYKVPEGQENIGGYEWQGLLNDDAPDPLSFIFSPRKNKINEIVKCVIVYPTTSMCQSMIAEEKSLIDRSAYKTQADYDTQLKIIENKYKPQYFHSEPIQFTNIQPYSDIAAANIAKGLSIITDWDGLKGSYYIYNSINEISSTSLAKEVRTLKASYKPIANDGLSIEKDATKIVWKIPLINTMIEAPKAGEDYNIGEAEGRWTETYALSDDKMFAIITREKPLADNSLEPTQTFKIKSRYLQSATNNTVTCEITMKDKVYEAQTQLNFGQSGNNGANATFVLSIKDGMNAIEPVAVQNSADGSKVYKAQRLTVEGRIYDYQNKDVTDEYTSFKWDWYRGMNRSGDGKSLSITPGDNPNECYIDLVGDPYKALGYILKADVSYSVTDNVALNPDEIAEIEESNQSQAGDNTVGSSYNTEQAEKRTIFLTAFLGIPINFNKEAYTFVEAPDKIVYDTNGTHPTYYDDYLKIFKTNSTTKKNELVTKCEWIIGVDGKENEDPENTNEQDTFGENEKWKKYYPEVQIVTEEYSPPPSELSINSKVTDTIKTTTDDDIEITGVYQAIIMDKTGVNPVENADGNTVYSMMEVTQKYTIINETTGESLLVNSGDDVYKLYEALLKHVEAQEGYKANSASLSNVVTDKCFIATFQFSNSDVSNVDSISYGGTFNDETSASYDTSNNGENTKATAVFGPKVKAPNMYYSNLTGSVYLNCYAYYEKPDEEIDASTDPNYTYGSATSTSDRTTQIEIESVGDDDIEVVVSYTVTGEGEVPEPDQDPDADEENGEATDDFGDVSTETTDEEEGYDESENGASYSDIEVVLEGDEDAYGNPLPIIGQRVLVWSQPLLIIQNRYPSAALNAWDGGLTVDEENNRIMTSMLAAGYKESDNSYTGVVMGSVGSEIGANTGVYGFHKGAQVYALKDNGTAFFGKSGSGQIRFDGNKGTIQSGNYKSGESGMILDLDGEDPLQGKGPYIEMNGDLASVRMATNAPYFQISAKEYSVNENGENQVKDVPLIYIGSGLTSDNNKEGKYYLQTKNFIETNNIKLTRRGLPVIINNQEISINNPMGFKIDLQQGTLQSYGNFELSGYRTTDTDDEYKDIVRWKRGIYLSSVGSDTKPFLRVSTGTRLLPDNADNIQVKPTSIHEDILVNIDNNNMHFQSPDYKITGSGMKINFATGGKGEAFVELKKTYNADGETIAINDETGEIDSGPEEVYCKYCGSVLVNGSCPQAAITFDETDEDLSNEPGLSIKEIVALGCPQEGLSSTSEVAITSAKLNELTRVGLFFEEEIDSDGKTVYEYYKIVKKTDSENNDYYYQVSIGVKSNLLNRLYACPYCGVGYNSFETDYLVLDTNNYNSFIGMAKCKNNDCILSKETTSSSDTYKIQNKTWKIKISPTTPYFQVLTGDTENTNTERFMVHIGDKNFQFISNSYVLNYANSLIDKGMKVRLNYGDQTPYIHNIGGYFQATNTSLIKGKNNLKGKRDIVITGESGVSYPIYIRELKSVTVKDGALSSTTYSPKFRVSWNGAVYARAYYLLDKNNNTRIFASGGDENYFTRIPQYTYYKNKRDLTNIISWRTLQSSNYNKTYTTYQKQWAEVSHRYTGYTTKKK